MQKIKIGMVGGGDDAFIGNIHRLAARLDGRFELVCGAFSQSGEKSLASGRKLGIDDARCYADYNILFQTEASLPNSQRMQAVIIVTPNVSHFAIAEQALLSGFHVFCEKPVTFTLDEAKRLKEIHAKTNVIFALAHTYCGYPMVVEAKERIAQGQIGEIRKVVVDYSQGWLAEKFLDKDQKQASWRLDPDKSGISCCMGDIGVHAANIARYLCDQSISTLLADLGTFTDGRQLDDDGSVFFRLQRGARGLLNASQISVGEENNLSVRIYGDTGSIKWHQESPNELWVCEQNQPYQRITSGSACLSQHAAELCRTPSGHPGGFIEALANLYGLFAQSISLNTHAELLPGIDEGVSGMAFIQACVDSHQNGNVWTHLATAEEGSV